VTASGSSAFASGGGQGAAQDAPAWLIAWGRIMFRHRDWVFPVVLLALFVVFSPRLAFGTDRLDSLLDLAGAVVSLIGQTLRAAVVGFFSIARSGKDKTVHADELMTRGMFATSRNPLYVGNLLILLGVFMIWNSPWVYGIGGLFFLLAYRAIVAAEEQFLLDRFGEPYDAYRARVRRWLPDFSQLGQPAAMEGVEFRWRRIVLKEYGNIAYLVSGALALCIADTLAFGTYLAHASRVNLMSAGIGLAVLGWGVARWLKKSRKLRD
jgi:protein-S-isoprenylcysteine O-methyltransferase Ste14